MRTKLEQTTLKNSRMEELIKGVSRVREPLDTSSIEAELFGSNKKRKTKINDLKNSNQTISFTDRQSTTIRDGYDEKKNRDEVEENIEMGEDYGEEKEGGVKVNKRRKNKHVNRYK